MVAIDKCREFILSTALHFFGVSDDDIDENQSILERFLNDSNCRTLYAQPVNLGNDRQELSISDRLPNGGKTLVFFKLSGKTVTKENFHDLVEIVSTGLSDGSALIESLRRVWPAIFKTSGLNPSVLEKLENELLGRQTPATIADELRHWRTKQSEAKRSRDKTRYSEAVKILENIDDELANAAASIKDRTWMSTMEDVVEAISGFIDDLWKLDGPTYTEDRMKLLFDVIGNRIAAIAANLVEIRDFEIDAISGGANFCGKWTNAAERLTGLFWPHQSLHPWRSSVFVPEKCSKLAKRLGQIADLRAQHRQLTRLLTENERSALGTDDLLQKFEKNDAILKVDDDIEWERLKRQVEEGLSPAEERVAQKLKTQIGKATTSPSALIAEFQRYADLAKREKLRQVLRGERETLLASYRDLIESSLAGPDTENLLDDPKIFREIQAARAAELRLASLNKLGKILLSDLSGYEEISEKLSSALKEAEQKKKSLIENWVSDTREAVARKELTLRRDSTVVELTGSSLMRVNYDPRLLSLVREARGLSAQGVELPRDVRELVELAGSLASRATALRQVANFHNTIGDRMVPSQRPLMLSSALELARAVQEQSGVVWADPRAVDVYTVRLRDLVKKFARQNAELAAKHMALKDLVSGLFRGEAINLIANQGSWKETLSKMRSLVDSVEAEYGNTKAWKLHWDRQLLKALDVAYRGSLAFLLKRLPEIKVELTFREGKLQWRPSLEEIRAKVYSSVRRSLSIPLNFRGVGDPSDARFSEIVGKNAYLFGGVYKEAEFMLEAVESVRLKWLNLAAPATINVGERLSGKPAQEWSRAFKDAKAWAQEVGKLRGGEVKVWCVNVETITLRNDLESASRRCWERLCSDLRAETSSRLVAVVDFLSSASKDLEKRPRNVEEVGLAYEAHARIEKESANLAQEIESVVGLAKVLASWTGERLDGMKTVDIGWQGLSDRLAQHKLILARQLEDAKVNLRHKAEALRDERERWEVKWSSRGESIDLEWIAIMRERWADMQTQRNSLLTDCRRIGLNVEEILAEEDAQVLGNLEKQLEMEESNCKFREEFLAELKKQEAEEWTILRRRLPRLQDWLDSWENRTRNWAEDQREERTNREENSVKETTENESFVEKKIREIRAAIEFLQILRGDELAEEHWTELRTLFGLNDVTSSFRDVTFGHLLGSVEKIRENIDRVKEITKGAAAESGIRQALSELETWENSTSLRLQGSKDSKGTTIFIVEEYGSSLGRAGELRLLLEGAKGTSGYERFASRVARYEAGLSELEERINALSNLQRKWIYLEPIYGAGAAPNDSGRWVKADKEFRYLMGEVSKDPRIPSLRRLPLPALTNLKDLFDRCQRSLDEFLEEKRCSYPRLYFLSDEDLLELVSGKGKALDAHLPKLFQGIGSVVREGNLLTGVLSPETERLTLLEPVDLGEPLPRWLGNLEEAVRNVLRRNLDKCLTDSTPDPSVYPAQILLLSERIRFTERCSAALKEGRSALKNFIEYLETQRAKYRGLEDAGDKLTALKARALLLDTVHHLRVTRALLKTMENGEDASWTWHRQLRNYKTSKGPVIKCAGAEFPYRFEYQGAAVGLVRTSLTERCFLALSQAMKLGLGGSPTGPAGTGKTESVKALAAMLGRRVLVFNCDEGMDSGSMKRILGGLAQAGAWGCFDEFNRLEEETLSAVAMLVRPLQEAIRDGLSEVQLAEEKVKLDPDCCVFITMNPAGEEYGGRHKLPDSLARLFRPIGMAHPDKSDIARALLECAGFLEAQILANKLVAILDMSETFLSRQPHYDWGLRALRSILDDVPNVTEGIDESTRLYIAIRNSTVAKLTEEDSGKFLSLLKDVFPSVCEASSSYVSAERQDLRKLLLDLCEERGLTVEIAERCGELKDQLKTRTGVAIVGPPGSGKSTVRKLLADALAKMGLQVDQIILYPGAMPKSRLLGRVDPQTREWKEGLLSKAISNAGDIPTWIVFNGDVESDWAEALNSALDDNRCLTLPNGVGMKLPLQTRFIFETHELSTASPATVSRLGVIHLASINSSSILSSRRLESLPSTAKELASMHLSSCVDQALKKIGPGKSSASGLIESSICQLRDARTSTSVTRGFLISLCGQIADQKSRNEMADLIFQLTDCWCPEPRNPYDVIYNEDTDKLEPFNREQRSIKIDDLPILMRGGMERALSGISSWAKGNIPILIRGQRSSGKSSLISGALEAIGNGEITAEISSLVRVSALYGARELISRIKRACVKLDSAHGRFYRPKNSSRLIVVVENLHLASQDLQELLRELLQEGGFHEDDLEFAKVPLLLMCTADLGSKLHPRLESLFATHYLPFPKDEEIVSILHLHLSESLKNAKLSVNSWISRSAEVMLESLRSIDNHGDRKFPWTLKDLVSWANCLRFYPSPETETDLARFAIDVAQRLFYPRLSSSNRNSWMNDLTSKIPSFENLSKEVYVSRGGSVGLFPFPDEEWREEVGKIAARCAREGEPVRETNTTELLRTVADISWALGANLRGIALTGRPGAGRKSSVKLAAALSNLRIIDSAPGRGKVAAKSAIQAAGIDGERTILLLEEYHVREEGLAVLASAIASNGELPGLFSLDEELEGLVAPLADLARREDFSGPLEHFLYHRLRRYLRVFLVLDSEDRRESWLIRSGIFEECVTVGPGPGCEWWTSGECLRRLATLEKVLDSSSSSDEGIDAIVEAHLRASEKEKVPARFLALLRVWREIKKSWEDDVEKKLSNLEAGIGRLKEAGDQVAQLEDRVFQERQELEVEKGRAAAALEQITATMRGATGQRGEMASLKAETEKESAELARRKADIEGELSKVEPLVEQAAQAVAGISADALAEVRSLRAPPAPVRDVLEGVLRLMGIKDTSWNSMKTFLAKRGIKDEIRTWDARRSTAASLEAVGKLVKERRESFEEKTAKRASVAAAPLAAWVLANLQYGQILQQVAPLEREQRLLAERLSAAEAQLGKLAAGLNSVESRVAELQEELAAHSRGAAALQVRTEATESSLTTARILLEKLDSEHRDWQSQLEELNRRKARLDVEAANVANLLVYRVSERDDEWIRRAIELLVGERERILWRAQGLPVDTESLVAGTCALRGPLVPILLDPSGVAVSWLKRNVGSRLETCKPDDSRFLATLELAVRFGKPLLVEELVTFPSILLPLLRGRTLRVGDRTLPARDGFRLFLATRREKLTDVPSEADAVLFQVTLGSSDRSLAEIFVEKALTRENPELEEKRRETLELEEKLSGERDAARLELLVQLGTARGQDLLQEENSQGGGLLSSLETTRSKAREIAAAIEESRRTFDDISRRAKAQEKIAAFAAGLYKVIKTFTALSPLYVFSLEAFTDVYLKAVTSTADATLSEKDVDHFPIIKKRLIALAFEMCAKAAYRKHRLPLALHLALALNPISESERNFLLDEDVTSGNESTNSNIDVPHWVPEERRSSVESLARILPQVMGKLKSSWLEEVAGIYGEKDFNDSQKILVVKSLKPDYLHTALLRFAAERLNIRDLSPGATTLRKMAEDVGSFPVLLLLSPGADPGPELNAIAEGSSFAEISLGQGQVAQAEVALESVCRNGGWILLSNLQLALGWLARLESILRSANRHPSARIWLTTEECEGFYPGLAGLCRKFAYEPPEGVKRNVKRSFQQFEQRRKSSAVKNRERETDVAFGLQLCWLHGVLQERRKFVPQGWIRPYEWSEADLEAGYRLIGESRGNTEGDFQTGRGILDVAVYGGRLQDDYDSRALRAIIREIWSMDVFEGRKELGGVLSLAEIRRSRDAIGSARAAIDRLSDDDPPREYFGLPANARGAWERSAAEIALTLLREASRKTKDRQGKMTIGDSDGLKTAEKNRLIELIDREKYSLNVAPASENGKSENPLRRFFIDEIQVAKKLLKRIGSDLRSARFDSLKIPKHWQAEWRTGPKEIVAFVESLLSRQEIFQRFATEQPKRLNISRLIRPLAFLAALRQHCAHLTGKPIENLQLLADWTEKSSLEDDSSIVVEGLLISGAVIKRGILEDLESNAPPVTTAPPCRIFFGLDENSCDDSGISREMENRLEIPVYSNSNRDILVCAIPVGCPRENRDDWLRRGVAFHFA